MALHVSQHKEMRTVARVFRSTDCLLLSDGVRVNWFHRTWKGGRSRGWKNWLEARLRMGPGGEVLVKERDAEDVIRQR